MSIINRFDFNVVAWLHSESVDRMSDTEVGQFISLLAEAWVINKATSLPDDIPYLTRKAHATKLSDAVLEQFPLVETEWGLRRRNEQLYQVWLPAKERCDRAEEKRRVGGCSTSDAKVKAARENGKSGGRPKNPTNNQTYDEPTETQTETHGNPSGNPRKPTETQGASETCRGFSQELVSPSVDADESNNPTETQLKTDANLSTVPSRPVSTRPATTRLDTTRASSQNELAGEGGKVFFQKAAAIGMGLPSKSEMAQLQTLVATDRCGLEFLKHAVLTEFQNRPQGLAGLKNPWRMFLSEADTHFANAKATLLSSGDWRLEHVPGEREQQQASIAHQNVVIAEQWAVKPTTNMEDPDIFFAMTN
jgi:hypothetical protein